MSDETIERRYITVAQPIEGSVIINDEVYGATVVGVEIVDYHEGDAFATELVAIVGDEHGYRASKVDFVYCNEHHAEAELKRRLNLRAERAAFEAAERERQAAS